MFMPIHRKIITIVGLGMFLVVVLVTVALLNIISSFSAITAEVDRTAGKIRQIESIGKEITAMSAALHSYVDTRDPRSREDYGRSRAAVNGLIDAFGTMERQEGSGGVTASIHGALAGFEKSADRLFRLQHPAGADRTTALGLLADTDRLTRWLSRDLTNQFQEAQSLQITKLTDYVVTQRERVLLMFMVVVLLSMGLLFGFSIYIDRQIATPLRDLWRGASEISSGNLDYQIRLEGRDDVAQLAERFNDMAQKLRRSYSELENKLLERTHELAAIDAVALTLSRAGNLQDMLARSLDKLLESLSGLAPQGGIFLCEPDGETMRLMAHTGLSPEFVEAEKTIMMGECLCGQVAKNGELLYSGKTCTDVRHTRGDFGHAHSHIIIPIKSRGIVLGVVFLYPQKEYSLKPSDLQMLDTIGVQLGMAVENLRFYAEVKESSEKFWDLFENSRDILFTTDAAGTLTAANKAAEKFSGYTKTELIGKSILEFLTPEGAETARGMLHGEGRTRRKLIEFEVIRRDGSRAFIEMSARRLFRQKAPSGYQISARDMTEQKHLREQLLKAERLGAITEIVITVRHEINNPLTTVIGNIELLIERYASLDPDLAMRLESILNNSLRIAEIVKQLQAIKRDKVVDYVKGISMTDLKQE